MVSEQPVTADGVFCAAAEPDIKAKLLKGHKAAGKTFKVHLDGYNLLPYFKGEVKEGPRKEFFYWTDDGQLANLRYGRWKLVFMGQRAHGFDVWQDPLVELDNGQRLGRSPSEPDDGKSSRQSTSAILTLLSWPFGITSATGEKTRLMPTAPASTAVTHPCAKARSGTPVAPTAICEGSTVPPSSCWPSPRSRSDDTRSGCSDASASSRFISATESTFPPKIVYPPTPRSVTSSRSRRYCSAVSSPARSEYALETSLATFFLMSTRSP